LTDETTQSDDAAEQARTTAPTALEDAPVADGETAAGASASADEPAAADATDDVAADAAADVAAGEPVADGAAAEAAEPATAEHSVMDEVIDDTAGSAEMPPADAEGTSAEPAPAAEDDAGTAMSPVAMDAAPADEEPEPIAAPTPAGPEPTTMAELLDAEENEVKSLKHGDVVEGTVVRIDPDEILVDFGGKSEGVVSNRELLSRRGPREGEDQRPELKMGDEVLVYVLQPESPEGHAVLSLRRAGLERKWRAMQERFDAGEIVEARVIDHNKGGLIVDLGVRGFVPISQIVDFPRRPRDEQPRDAAQEIAEKLQPYIGRTLRLKILEVNRKANRLILSEKVALYEERREKRDELFSSLQVSQRVTGQVRSIAPFGVFIDLGGIDGLVHKSELSWNKVNNPETAYQIGDEVEAEVIDINHERGRISLSIRRLQPDPWQESVAKYKIGDVIDGTVTKLVNFGAFVRVEEGLEGLIHISELSHQRVAHPGDVVKEGETVKLRIISLDSERHRLGLSLKQAEDRPTAQARATDDRPRRPGGRDRRDRFDYRPEDAIAEPEGGIDSTMAAAFASSGLLDQFRTDEAPAEKPAAADAASAADEAPTAEPDVPTAEPDAEAVAADEATEVETTGAPAAAEPAAPDEAATPEPDASSGVAEAEAPSADAEAPEAEAEARAVPAEADPAPDAEAPEAEAEAEAVPAEADPAPDAEAAAAEEPAADQPPVDEPPVDEPPVDGEAKA
jgi:small subunit ribosomal protein S1